MESSEEKEEERPTPVLDDAERQRLTKQRFPGASELELVRVVFWPEERSGVCWTEIDPAGKMPLEVRYTVGADGKEKSGSSFRELREQGWLGIYRTPAGTGFERRADFRMVDLTVTPEFRCRCFATEKAEEGSHIPVRVRFRWKGPGNMPEVSARAGERAGATGLKAGFSTGNLFTYEFPVVGSFPDDRPGRCGGNIVLSLLLQPPML
jgi:hypothetical protein